MDSTKQKGNTDMRADQTDDHSRLQLHFRNSGVLSVAMYAAMCEPKPTPVAEGNYNLIAALAPDIFPVRSYMAKFHKKVTDAHKLAKRGRFCDAGFAAWLASPVKGAKASR